MSGDMVQDSSGNGHTVVGGCTSTQFCIMSVAQEMNEKTHHPG
jgi:hypothetical protein